MTQTAAQATSSSLRRKFGAVEIHLTYADCDPAGIVYYATWFPWFERLLTQWMHSQGLRPDELMARYGFATITRHAECEYLHPAALFDTIRITMVAATIRRTSIQWEFTIVRTTDQVKVGRGQIALVTIDADGRATPVPAQMRAAIEAA